MEVNEAGDDDLEESTMNQWGMFWLIWMSLLAVCSACVAFAWIKFPENKVVQRSQEYVMAGLLTIMGVMIITIFLKLIWPSGK
jgi:magnesium-transporting ATPase (P-type)